MRAKGALSEHRYATRDNYGRRRAKGALSERRGLPAYQGPASPRQGQQKRPRTVAERSPQNAVPQYKATSSSEGRPERTPSRLSTMARRYASKKRYVAKRKYAPKRSVSYGTQAINMIKGYALTKLKQKLGLNTEQKYVDNSGVVTCTGTLVLKIQPPTIAQGTHVDERVGAGVRITRWSSASTSSRTQLPRMAAMCA